MSYLFSASLFLGLLLIWGGSLVLWLWPSSPLFRGTTLAGSLLISCAVICHGHLRPTGEGLPALYGHMAVVVLALLLLASSCSLLPPLGGGGSDEKPCPGAVRR